MLNMTAYEQLFNRVAEQFRWLKALPCDCYDPTTNYDVQRGCQKCLFGHVYFDQGIKRGLIGSQKRNVMNPELGWVQVREAVVTTMPDEVLFGQFDKLVLVERETLERSVMRRGDDTLPHEFIIEILMVVSGETVYQPGIDYEVDLTAGTINWLTAGPTQVYAIEYKHNPVYWFTGYDERPPRPAGNGLQTPPKGMLSLTPPQG